VFIHGKVFWNKAEDKLSGARYGALFSGQATVLGPKLQTRKKHPSLFCRCVSDKE